MELITWSWLIGPGITVIYNPCDILLLWHIYKMRKITSHLSRLPTDHYFSDNLYQRFMQFAFLRFPNDYTHFIYLVFRCIRFFFRKIKFKLTSAKHTMCLVTEWSRSTTSPKWLICLISGALITNSDGFVKISWVNVGFIVCIWYPNKFYGGQSSCNQNVFSRFCRSYKRFLSFLSFLPLLSLQTRWLVEQMKQSLLPLYTSCQHLQSDHSISTFAKSSEKLLFLTP